MSPVPEAYPVAAEVSGTMRRRRLRRPAAPGRAAPHGALWALGAVIALARTPMWAMGAEGVAPRRLAPLPSTYLEYTDPSTERKVSWFTTFDASGSTVTTNFVVQRMPLGRLGVRQHPGMFERLYERFGVHVGGFQPWYGLVEFAVHEPRDSDGASWCDVVEVGKGSDEPPSAAGDEVGGCRLELPISWTGKYSFATTVAAGRVAGRTVVTAYYHDQELVVGHDLGWRLVGAIEVALDEVSLGYGGLSSYIEGLQPVMPDAMRLAKYGPQLLEEAYSGRWVPIREADFTLSQGIEPYAYSVGKVSHDEAQFVMGSEGRHVASAGFPAGTTLQLRESDRDAREVLPSALLQFLLLRRQGRLPAGRRLVPGHSNEQRSEFFWFAGAALFGRAALWAQSPLDEQVLVLMLVCILLGTVGCLCCLSLRDRWRAEEDGDSGGSYMPVAVDERCTPPPFRIKGHVFQPPREVPKAHERHGHREHSKG